MYSASASPLALTALALSACATQPQSPAAAPNQAQRAGQEQVAATDPAALTAMRLRFLEPAHPGTAVDPGMRKQWRDITDTNRLAELRSKTDTEAVRFANALFNLAWDLAPPQNVGTPSLFVGIEPGGNHARLGFTLFGESGPPVELPTVPVLLLDEDDPRLGLTLLHEIAHAIHAMLVQRDDGEESSVAPIPHSTAAVTDRRTAFNEGLAIHLETTIAHCGKDPDIERFYKRHGNRVGEGGFASQYYAAVIDMASYAQGLARYSLVRDGLYAFEAAVAAGEPDYLRIQLIPDRDRRALRSPNAIVANEGFVASLLFHTLASDCDDVSSLLPRYRVLFEALTRGDRGPTTLQANPLINFVVALTQTDAALGERSVNAFLDLSHGVTMDSEAPTLWREFYNAALHLDIASLRSLHSRIEERRRLWRKEALADPHVLARRIGPVVVLRVPGTQVGVKAFGSPKPIDFDINAAGPALLGVVEGLDPTTIVAILRERDERPFANTADFFARFAGVKMGLQARPETPSPSEPGQP